MQQKPHPRVALPQVACFASFRVFALRKQKPQPTQERPLSRQQQQAQEPMQPCAGACSRTSMWAGARAQREPKP